MIKCRECEISYWNKISKEFDCSLGASEQSKCPNTVTSNIMEDIEEEFV